MWDDDGRRSKVRSWREGCHPHLSFFTLVVYVLPSGFLLWWPVNQDEMSFHQFSNCFIECTCYRWHQPRRGLFLRIRGFILVGERKACLFGAHTHADTLMQNWQ